MALKRTHIELRDTSYQFGVTDDEMDAYRVYSIVMPNGINASQWFGSWAVAGTAATGNLVIINALPDYPRNAEFSLTGTAAGMTGTATINGKNQFGEAIQEIFTFAGAANGGTVVGTKVFAQITNGTLAFGTAVGNGTARLGMGTAGTTTLFGLPCRIAGTGDVRSISVVAGTGGVTVNGGTIGAFVNVGQSAIKLPGTLAGTMTINAWVRPTYQNEGVVAGLTQK
jgi:hypothetical protein